MNIGFIGLGSMGTRLVELLIGDGHRLTVWARRAATLAPFRGAVTIAGSPREVAESSEVVGVCVWSESDVEQVLATDDGILAGMAPGGVVIIHSTISAEACRRFAAQAAEAEIRLIDAPVSVGSSLPKVLVMVGGEPDAVERCRPALESFGDPVLHLGPVGSGQMAKIINNTLVAATVAVAADALAFGDDLGLDVSRLSAALASGSARGTWSSFLPRSEHSGAPSFATAWAGKDVGCALDLASQTGLARDRLVLSLARRGVDLLAE